MILHLLHPDGQMDSQIYKIRARQWMSDGVWNGGKHWMIHMTNWDWSSYCEMKIFPSAPSTFALRKSKRKNCLLSCLSICLFPCTSQCCANFNTVLSTIKACVLVFKWKLSGICHRSKHITNPKRWKNVIFICQPTVRHSKSIVLCRNSGNKRFLIIHIALFEPVCYNAKANIHIVFPSRPQEHPEIL